MTVMQSLNASYLWFQCWGYSQFIPQTPLRVSEVYTQTARSCDVQSRCDLLLCGIASGVLGGVSAYCHIAASQIFSLVNPPPQPHLVVVNEHLTSLR